jgi:Domain of unknown function (DUF4123)
VANRHLTITDSSKEHWRELCAGGQLYAIVDSCDEWSVHEKVEELGPERAVSLYRGSAEEEYATIAPYLIHVEPESFDWITGPLWGPAWGVFSQADAPLEALRTHFRHYLKVKAPDGEQYLFRFYDPRVLPPFLESCSDAELHGFFGPVEAFGAASGDRVLRLERGSRAHV